MSDLEFEECLDEPFSKKKLESNHIDSDNNEIDFTFDDEFDSFETKEKNIDTEVYANCAEDDLLDSDLISN